MGQTIIPLSIVIPTMNRHKSVVDAVQSLCAGSCIPSQIIVIDQSPKVISINSFKIPRGVRLEVLHLTTASTTLARNIGIAKVKEEFILFCDDDILVDENSLERTYARIIEKQIALVAGIHDKANVNYSGLQNRNLLKDIFATILGMKQFWRTDGYVIKYNMRGRYATGIKKCTNTDWAMGYYFCIKKSILDKMDHYFDEHLIRYAYSEDLDFTIRYCSIAKKNGLKTIVDPEIYVIHLVSNEWRVPKQEGVDYAFVNRRYLSWKLYPNRWDYRLLMGIMDRLYLLTQIKNKDYANEIRSALKLCRDNKRSIRSGEIANLRKE